MPTYVARQEKDSHTIYLDMTASHLTVAERRDLIHHLISKGRIKMAATYVVASPTDIALHSTIVEVEEVPPVPQPRFRIKE